MKFTEGQAAFLKRELDVAVVPGEKAALSREEWLNIKDEVFLIEADEARPDGSLSERGRIAVEIGNLSYSD